MFTFYLNYLNTLPIDMVLISDGNSKLVLWSIIRDINSLYLSIWKKNCVVFLLFLYNNEFFFGFHGYGAHSEKKRIILLNIHDCYAVLFIFTLRQGAPWGQHTISLSLSLSLKKNTDLNYTIVLGSSKIS